MSFRLLNMEKECIWHRYRERKSPHAVPFNWALRHDDEQSRPLLVFGRLGSGIPLVGEGWGSWGVVVSAGPFGRVYFLWVWNYWWLFDPVANKVK